MQYYIVFEEFDNTNGVNNGITLLCHFGVHHSYILLSLIWALLIHNSYCTHVYRLTVCQICIHSHQHNWTLQCTPMSIDPILIDTSWYECCNHIESNNYQWKTTPYVVNKKCILTTCSKWFVRYRPSWVCWDGNTVIIFERGCICFLLLDFFFICTIKPNETNYETPYLLKHYFITDCHMINLYYIYNYIRVASCHNCIGYVFFSHLIWSSIFIMSISEPHMLYAINQHFGKRS